MNRREFCQTAALCFAGCFADSVCADTSLSSEKSIRLFRAKKFFWNSLEYCGGKNGKKPLCRVEAVRKNLEEMRRNRCNGVILMPESRSSLERVKQIVTEANGCGLNVFVPVCQSQDYFARVETAVPLSDEFGILQSSDGKPATNGGFLLYNQEKDISGLILYDLSRCLWTSFALFPFALLQAGLSTDLRQDTVTGTNASRLVAARCLDLICKGSRGNIIG